MTSRVQKGGPIFRPVAKSRARPEVTQSSAPTDNPATSQNVPNSSLPPSLPTPSPALSAESSVPRSVPPTVIPSTTIPTARIPPQNTLASPAIPLGRSSPAPPTLGTSSRATPFPPIIKQPLPSSPLVPSLPAETQASSSTAPPPNAPTPKIIPTPDIENVLTITSNIDIQAKPPRTSTRKTSTSSPNGSTVGAQQTVDDSTPALKTRKTSCATSTAARKTLAKRKKKSTSSDAEVSDDESQSTSARRKRRASSTPHPRRSRGPSLPPYDPDADPGEEIDPTVVTMASLCEDTGQGRVSRKAAEILSNHAAWKIQSREKRARMKALMELKKYGREDEAEALEASSSTPADKSSETAEPAVPAASTAPTINDDTGSGFDYTQDLATSRFNVQVRIGPNGETIIDEESLVVDRVEAEDTTDYTHVVESDHTKFVNSGSYGKRYRGSRWSAEETELFFDALAQYGENYELIAYVLPGRDRKSCKNKFKAEDKKNPARINHCLNNNIPVDMATLSRMTGKDFSGPVPEIRIATPQPIEPSEATGAGQEASPPQPMRKKPIKKSRDDGVMIVGDADSFVPFPDSP